MLSIQKTPVLFVAEGGDGGDGDGDDAEAVVVGFTVGEMGCGEFRTRALRFSWVSTI